MILLTRLNGAEFALNPDLVERAECTPDTVVTLVDGTKYVVQESVAELAARVRAYRAAVLAEAHALESTLDLAPAAVPTPVRPDDADAPRPDPDGRVVRLHRRES